MKKLLLTFLASLFFLTNAQAQCDPVRDSLTLVTIYNKTDGPNWNLNPNFYTPWRTPGEPISNWYGITVDSNGCVECIDLDGVSSTSQPCMHHLGVGIIEAEVPLPPEFGDLTELKSLFLARNNFTGFIPSELEKLSKLERLSLYDNLIDDLPPEFGNLTELTELHLAFNNLDALPESFGGLINLSYLDLSRNNLRWLPNSIGNLKQVEELNLVHNKLTELPTTFGDLEQLKDLNLNSNPLSELPPSFVELDSLETLSAQSTLLKTLPPEFGDLQNLKMVDCFGSQLTEIIPQIGNLENLEWIRLERNNISGEIPSTLGNCSKLQILSLASNKITGSIPPELGNCTDLRVLDLSENKLTGFIPKELGQLYGLGELDLHNNQLWGGIPSELSVLPELRWLYLNDNRFLGALPTHLGDFPALTRLELGNNSFTGAIPKELGNLRRLQRIDLSNNNLEGPIPIELATMSIEANFGLPPTGVVGITYNFSGNHLSGELPGWMGNDWVGKAFITLDLSDNQFTGTIPAGFAKSKFVSGGDLLLNDNELSGTIPDELDALSLDVFDVSNNRFSFEIFPNIINISASERVILPQKPFYRDTVFHVSTGDSLSIDLGIDENLQTNVYYWTKNGEPWQPDPGYDSTQNTLLIEDIAPEDAGVYQAFVRNTIFSGINFESHPFELRVCDVEEDSLLLVDLYNSTNGNAWNNDTNWLQSGAPIGSWYGVKADVAGCVHKLDLTGNNLSGALPELRFSSLDTLILADNDLSGVVPEVHSLFLRYMDMSGNSLEGPIELPWSKRVQALRMSDNSLTGSLPSALYSLSSLHSLDLSNNQLSDTLSLKISDLTQLEELRLDGNNLEGELPVSVIHLRNLTVGKVGFGNSQIDSLKSQIAYMCPFGDTILANAPGYDQFRSMCEGLCDGDEWQNINDNPWMADVLRDLSCDDSLCRSTVAKAGFAQLRGVNVFFTLQECYGSGISSEDKYVFYDCRGNYLDSVLYIPFPSSYAFSYGITMEDFENMECEIIWVCGDEIPMVSDVEDVYWPEEASTQNGTVEIKVWPNPTTGAITFPRYKGMDINKLYCINAWGQRVPMDVKENGQEVTLGLPSNIPGMYVLVVPGDVHLYTSRFILQK